MTSLADMDRRLARLERQNRLLTAGCLVLGPFPFLLGSGQVQINVDKPIVGQLGKLSFQRERLECCLFPLSTDPNLAQQCPSTHKIT